MAEPPEQELAYVFVLLTGLQLQLMLGKIGLQVRSAPLLLVPNTYDFPLY